MKKLSKILVLVLTFVAILSINTFAKSDILLSVDGKKVDTDAAAFIENGRTLVPVRFISEALDKKVEWDSNEKKVTILDDKGEVSKIELKIESDKANLYDKNQNKKEITLDAKAKIVNDRTFVPVRFIAESLGVNVDWDNDNRVVIIGDKAKYNKDEFTKIRQKESKKVEEKSENKIVVEKEAAYMSVDTSGSLYIMQDETNPNMYIVSLFDNGEGYEIEPVFVSSINTVYDANKKSYIYQDEEVKLEFKLTDYGLIWEGIPFIKINEDRDYDYKDNKIYENEKVVFDVEKFIKENNL